MSHRTLLAIVCIAAASTAGAAELEVYGKLNVTLQDSDEATQQQFELRNNSSRVGVRGEKPLNADLTAIYQLEWGVNLDDDPGQDTFTPRNQFVGLQGAFGTFKVGRHDTALKEAQGDFDLFNDLEGDIERVFNGENRLVNYIGYTTPALGKSFHVTVNLFPGEDVQSGNDGLADRTSASVTYQTDTLYFALAHDNDVEGEHVQTTRLVGGYTLGNAQFMVLYQRADLGAVDDDGFGASVAWTFGKYKARFQYLRADIWRTLPQADPLQDRLDSLISVGLDRKLSESVKLFGFYTSGDIGGTDASDRYAAVGIELSF